MNLPIFTAFLSFLRFQILLAILFVLIGTSLHSAPKDTQMAGSVELEFGLNPLLLVDQANRTKEYQLSTPTLGIRPVVEWGFNKIFFVGAEWGMMWQDADSINSKSPDEKRMVMLPHARARLDFPLSCRLVLEAVFAFGPNFWTKWRGADSEIGSRMLGIGYRFSAGLRFLVNTQVDLLFGVGYQQEYGYGDVDLQFSQIPVQLGLRTHF
jgi:hypothetical protein